MPYVEALKRGGFCPNLSALSKEALFEEFVDRMIEQDALCGTLRPVALMALREREARMSTGMQNGIALPHGKALALPELAVFIGLKPEGLDFGAIDGEPSRIFVVVLGTSLRPAAQMHFLACIGRALDKPAVRAALLRACNKRAMLDVLMPAAGGPNESGVC